MPKFNAGDRVLINGSLVATIHTYDEEGDRLSYVSTPPGGGTDTTYGHISQTRVEHLVTGPVGADEPVMDVNPKAKHSSKSAKTDEITTLESLS